ncbi:hypothetical protein BHM03_00059267, partial [Ensete ventricosum]
RSYFSGSHREGNKRTRRILSFRAGEGTESIHRVELSSSSRCPPQALRKSHEMPVSLHASRHSCRSVQRAAPDVSDAEPSRPRYPPTELPGGSLSSRTAPPLLLHLTSASLLVGSHPSVVRCSRKRGSKGLRAGGGCDE